LTGLPEAYQSTNGQEHGQAFPRKNLVFVAFNILEPLLNSRTTAAERMLCYFLFGISLFHEFGAVCPPRALGNPLLFYNLPRN
jgi:hypothetical protein